MTETGTSGPQTAAHGAWIAEIEPKLVLIDPGPNLAAYMAADQSLEAAEVDEVRAAQVGLPGLERAVPRDPRTQILCQSTGAHKAEVI